MLVAGQRVQQALYSPDYQRDRTLVAAVVSGPFPRLMVDTAAQSPGDEHATSAGLLLCTPGPPATITAIDTVAGRWRVFPDLS